VNPYALFGEFLGLVFIVLVFGGGHIRRFLDILERRWERNPPRARLSDEELKQLGQTQQTGGGVAGQIEALREELARLRDTSTQYDISIQHTLEDLQQRVTAIESRRRSSSAVVTEEEQQRVTLHSGPS
jgi:hypothetical protein